MPNSRSRGFRLEGCKLGKGNLFGDTDALDRIHSSIRKPSDSNLDQMNTTVPTALTKLFEALANSELLFKALRDNEIFWVAIGAQWADIRPLSSQDIKKLVEVYVGGRRNFLTNPDNHMSSFNNKTPLKEAVDRWIAVYDKVVALAPIAPTVKLTSNPQQTESTTWLPEHITVQEYLWICESHVEEHLRQNLEVDGRIKPPFLPKKLEEIPVLSYNLSQPTDMGLFLCFTGLARFDPASSKFAIFMQPIGFAVPSDRQDCYLATGSLSTKYATFTEYFQHAVRMIKNHGRDRVFGVVSYWIDHVDQYVGNYESNKKPGQTRHRYWNDNCLQYGLGLAVSKMPGDQPGYRVTVGDTDYTSLKTHPDEPNTGHEHLDELIVCMREWREDAGTAADMFFKSGLKEWWQGGYHPHDLLLDYKLEWNRRDSVSHSHAWLWDMVNGAGLGVEADDREMTRYGYERISMTEFDPSGIESVTESETGSGSSSSTSWASCETTEETEESNGSSSHSDNDRKSDEDYETDDEE